MTFQAAQKIEITSKVSDLKSWTAPPVKGWVIWRRVQGARWEIGFRSGAAFWTEASV